jgi:hypothetical protein
VGLMATSGTAGRRAGGTAARCKTELDEGGLAQGGLAPQDEGREEQSRKADGGDRRRALGMNCPCRVWRLHGAGGGRSRAGRTGVGLEDGGATQG